MREKTPLLLMLLGGAGASALVLSAGIPLMQADSPSYIAGLPERTPGYPLLLALVALVSPDYRLLPEFQCALFTAAAIFFCDALGRTLRSPWTGTAVALAIFGNLFLMRSLAMIMSEAPYLALVLAHLGCVLRSLDDSRPRWAVLAGLALGAAILVRPVGYALLFATPWLVAVWREARWRRTALYGAALTAVVFSACAGNLLTRGYFGTQAFGGLNLIFQVAALAPPEVEGFDPAVTRKTYEKLTPIRKALRQAPGLDEKTLVSALAFNLSWAVMEPVTAALTAREASLHTASPYWKALARNALATEFAKKVVAADPSGYALTVLHHLYGLWFYVAITDRATAEAVIAAGRDGAGWDRATVVDPNLKVVPAAVRWLKQAAFAVLLLLMLGALVAAPFDHRFGAPGYFAATSFCYCGVVALVEAALPRYSMIIWPEQCAVAAAALVAIRTWWRTRRRKSEAVCLPC